MAGIVGEERYVFETEWYDQQASLIRAYRVTYYPGDQTVEMVSGVAHIEENYYKKEYIFKYYFSMTIRTEEFS